MKTRRIPAELKPCPFCGSDEIRFYDDVICCCKCRIAMDVNTGSIDPIGGIIDSVKKWNRRAKNGKL